MQTREEFEAFWAEKFRVWELEVEGQPLPELVRRWHDQDPEANVIICRFTNESDENYRAVREVEGLVGQGSYFPGNHRDFDKLPKNLACRVCPAFYGVIDVSLTNMTILCEWPDRVQSVRVRLDDTAVGGARAIDGNCRFDFGVTR